MQGGGHTVFRDRLRLLNRLGCEVHVLTSQRLESRLTELIAFEWVSTRVIEPQIIRYLLGEFQKFRGRQGGRQRFGSMGEALQRLGTLYLLKNHYTLGPSRNESKSLSESSFARYFNRSFYKTFIRLSRFLAPDVVFTSFAWNAPLLDCCPDSTVRILDVHDVQYSRAEIAKAAGGDSGG